MWQDVAQSTGEVDGGSKCFDLSPRTLQSLVIASHNLDPAGILNP